MRYFRRKQYGRNKDMTKMINDLSTFINFIENKILQVILLIDANESAHSKQERFTTLLDKSRMTNLITNVHGATYKSNTHKRRPTKINFIFCTREISRFIARSSMFPFDYITTT